MNTFIRRCDEDGCDRPHRARGLCSTHYNQQHQTQEQRHTKVVESCDWCGKPCEKGKTKRYAARFCVLACRDAWARSTGAMAESLARAHAASATPRAQARRRLARAARGKHTRLTWVAGDCHSCGRGFVGVGKDARYCSALCHRRERRARHSARARARHLGIVRVPYSRVDVWRRDGWRCHLCGKKVRRDVRFPHPLSPTIDHLVPTSVGGDDAPHNVRCAHFICNSTRRDQGTVQLMLV